MEIGGRLTQGRAGAIRWSQGRLSAGRGKGPASARPPEEEGTMSLREMLAACALLCAMELWLLLACRVDGRFLLAFLR